MAGGGLVALVGNGLSIAVNEGLRLDTLTKEFLVRHDVDRDDLNRLVSGTMPEGVDASTDFEILVSGIETAEEVIRAFTSLAGRSTHPDLAAASKLLADAGVSDLARRLYFAYCSEVLGSIGELARADLPPDVLTFGEWLKEMYRAHGEMSVFTLNYDVLLERMLVNESILGLRHALTDMFSGLPDRMRDVELVPGKTAVGRLFYPEDPPPRPIALHHLHGCLTHFREETDASVWKFDSADVRDLDVYEYLSSAEASPFKPSVILGSRKVEKSREWPFSYAFTSLETAARAARTIVIVGYSFRDAAVNARLRAASTSTETHWIVINSKLQAARLEFEDAVRGSLGVSSVEFVLDGVGGPLPSVD